MTAVPLPRIVDTYFRCSNKGTFERYFFVVFTLNEGLLSVVGQLYINEGFPSFLEILLGFLKFRSGSTAEISENETMNRLTLQ